MFLHEELIIEGEISRELHDAAYKNLEWRLLKWHDPDLVVTPVQGATIVDDRPPRASGRGCMFSGGVDSGYSLSRHLDSITHLTFIQGFELPWKKDELAQDALRVLNQLAREIGREVLFLKGNLQELIEDLAMGSHEVGRPRRGFLIQYYFGSMLVTFNLCLRGILGHVTIPSSFTEASGKELGSHPELESNWSTSAIRFELDGQEADRIDKIAYIAAHKPVLFQYLRVCTHPPGGGVVNCGRCSKCFRTMMEMRLAGVGPDAYSNFQHPLSFLYARLSSYPSDGGLTEELYERAKKAGDRQIIRTLEIVLGKRPYFPRKIALRWYRWKLRKKNRRKLARKARRKGQPVEPEA